MKTQMKRKILIIIENSPVPPNTRIWQEATTLAANGYTVSVICPKGAGHMQEEEVQQGVHIFRHALPKGSGGALGYAREYGVALIEELRFAKKIYKEIGFDVIQGCSQPDDIYLVAKHFKKHGVKYVFDQHDICPKLQEARFGKPNGLLCKIQLWLEKQTYKNCTFAFSANESCKKIAVERGKMDPDKVIVLRNGPDMERMKRMAPVESLKHGFPYMVSYFGGIGQQEGTDYLLRAARYIKEHGNNVFWGIIGDGPQLRELKNQAHYMGLDDCLEFTGRVPEQKMLEYLNTADICVNCGKYNSVNDMRTAENILIYMALAKPIVQFDLTEGRYSAQEASLYAKRNDAKDMAEKIIELLNDPEKRKKMGEFGYNRVVNKLSWENTSKALLMGYEKLFTGQFD